MPTSVHIPKPLLVAVDHKARTLGISRNRLIVEALRREVEPRGWSPEFFAKLRVPLDPATGTLLDDTMAAVRTARRSKAPPKL